MSFPRAKRFSEMGSSPQKNNIHLRTSANIGETSRRRSSAESTKRNNIQCEDGKKSLNRNSSRKGVSLNQTFTGFNSTGNRIKEETVIERIGLSEDYYKKMVANIRDKNGRYQPGANKNEEKISDESEILCEVKRVINASRLQLKKSMMEKVYKFRKEAEEKIKTSLEAMDLKHQVFLHAVEYEYENITEGLHQDLSEVIKRSEKKNRNLVNSDRISPKYFKESQRYINFLENKYMELLKIAEDKIAEKDQLIDTLKTELDAYVLGQKLEEILTRRSYIFRSPNIS